MEIPGDIVKRQLVIDGQLPSRQQSVSGLMEKYGGVYARLSIAQKLYRCSVCTELIDIGSDNVLFMTLRKKTWNHHHQHRECFYERTLPEIGNLAIISSTQTTRSKMTRRRHR